MAAASCVIDSLDTQRREGRDAPVRGLQTDLLPACERPAIMDDWRALEQRIGDGSLMCSADWTETWLEHFGDLVPHRFVVARQDDRVCGVCLLTEGVGQTEGPFAVRTLHLGTAGEPDSDSVCVEYNRLLVEKNLQAEFARHLMNQLSRESSWDEVRMEGFAKTDCERLLARCNGFSLRSADAFCHDLAAARDSGRSAREQLGFATRKNIRKNLNAYGPLTTEWAESADRAEDILDEMAGLHQARWTAAGKHGSFASPRFTAFHKTLVRRFVPQGRAGMFRVRCESETVGCVQLYIDRNRVLCYQGGSAAYQGKLSPGMMVDYLCMEECLRRGFDAYDFLCGDSHHKQKLSTASASLAWAILRRPRMKFLVVSAARKIKCLAQKAAIRARSQGGESQVSGLEVESPGGEA